MSDTMTEIEENDTLFLHFVSRRPGGEVLEDSTEGEPQKITLGKKMINPAFEEALLGHLEGDTVCVTLPPEKAYGKYNKRLVFPLRRSKLKLTEEPHVGDFMTIPIKGKRYSLMVPEVTQDTIIVDGNPPYAGETISYEITVVKNLGHEEKEEA